MNNKNHSKSVDIKSYIFASLAAGLMTGISVGILLGSVSVYFNHYVEQGMYNLIFDSITSSINLCSGVSAVAFLIVFIIARYYEINSIKRGASVFVVLGLIMFTVFHYKGLSEFPDYWAYGGKFIYFLKGLLYSLAAIIVLAAASRMTRYLDNQTSLFTHIAGTKFTVLSIIILLMINGLNFIYRQDHTARGPNIILINIDTLRADHLSSYGYFRETSPNIDAFSTQGVLFENVAVEAPFTMPSVASLFTSRYPYMHGVRDHPDVRNHILNKESLTLAEALNNEGYVTAGITANSLISPKNGYDQGFSLYKYAGIASDVNDKTLKWLRKNFQKKFFLYVHYIDPHLAYAPPAEHKRTFDEDYEGEFKDSFQRPIKDKIFVNDLSERDINHAVALYDEEIKYADSQIGILLGKIKKMGVYDNSIIIITGDHGESLGEHGVYFAHDFYLYEPMTRVPLIIKFPNARHRNKRIDDVVRVIDIMPSILDIAHVSKANSYQGTSLLPAIRYGEKLNLYAYAESCSYRPNYGFTIPMERQGFYRPGIKGKSRMVRNGRWKLVFVPDRKKRLFELYNVEEDPRELNNVVDDYPEVFQQLKHNLFEFLEKDKQEFEDYIDLEKIDRGTLDVLKSLGYIK